MSRIWINERDGTGRTLISLNELISRTSHFGRGHLKASSWARFLIMLEKNPDQTRFHKQASFLWSFWVGCLIQSLWKALSCDFFFFFKLYKPTRADLERLSISNGTWKNLVNEVLKVESIRLLKPSGYRLESLPLDWLAERCSRSESKYDLDLHCQMHLSSAQLPPSKSKY